LFDENESIAIYNDPRTEAELARAIGVTVSVIRATRAKVRVKMRNGSRCTNPRCRMNTRRVCDDNCF
jgi:ribosomal protein L2